MKKKIFQLIPVIIVTFVTMTGFSYANATCTPKPTKPDECKPCPPCPCEETPTTVEPTTCAYNAPARVDIACGWDCWISGSFLYWQPRQKGLDVGYHTYPSVINGVNVTHSDPVNMDFDYHPAFKVGLGCSTDRDDWTFFVEYTRFYSSDSHSKDVASVFSDTNNLLSPWVYSDLYYRLLLGYGEISYIKGDWKLHTNILDLEIGRPFYLGKKLVFAPFFGARGGWIDQKYKFTGTLRSTQTETDTLTIYASNKSDSWLIGPRAGLDTKWLLGCGFRMFADMAAALFYQHFKTNVKQYIPRQTNVTTALERRYKNKIGYLTPNIEIGVGFGYGTYFADSTWHFDLTAGYEFHYFWNQNMMRHLNDGAVYLTDGDAGDLMLHGLTITAKFDF